MAQRRNFKTLGKIREGANSTDLREAILYAAWGLGRWAAIGRNKGEPPPEWALDVCKEFFVGVAVSPRIVDDTAKGPKPSRTDLRLMLEIARLRSDPAEKVDGKQLSVRGALLKLLPVHPTNAGLETAIKRLTDMYNHQMPGVMLPDGKSNPADDILAKGAAAQRGLKQLGEEEL